MFGHVKDPVGRTADGRSLRYGEDRQIIDAGFVMTDEMRAVLGDTSYGGDEVRPGLFEFFHTDDSYTECPASVTVLHARELPRSGGGDTCFLDMRAAFEILDRDERDRIVGLHAVHAYNNEGAFPPRAPASGDLEALVEVAHPIVRAHPVTGRPALYFDLDRAKRIVELPTEQGRALLRGLQDHAEQHAPRYAHAWRDHDVLIWDNAAVQHKASNDFPVGERRRFWRYMVEGSLPRAPAGAEHLPRSDVVVRPVSYGDAGWVLSAGLDWEKVGRQYHWLETPLQLYVAPARAVLGPRARAVIVEVDGRRAGYIGRNPLSGNLEYFLQSWARGRGIGTRAIEEFLTKHRHEDCERRFVVKHGNGRSLGALLRALERLGWSESRDYRIVEGTMATSVWVRSTSTP